MSRTRNRFVISAVAAAGLFAGVLAMSPTAVADPAAPLIPGVPGANMLQQLAPQLLQSFAAAFLGNPAAPAAVPAAPAAGAAVDLPQAAPAAVPAAVPAAPATGADGLIPTAQVDLPSVPGLPVPLPSQLSLPGDLAALAPGGLPMPDLAAKPAAAAMAPAAAAPAAVAPVATAAAPAESAIASFFPVSGLP
jgi:hypothetical protein